jgi:hypothetical protein
VEKIRNFALVRDRLIEPATAARNTTSLGVRRTAVV